MSPNSLITAESWSKTGRADPMTVSYFRELMSLWLDDAVVVDAQQHADIVLATDEALANCADHAYRGGTPGSMTMTVGLDPRVAAITVCISDHGTWVEPNPSPRIVGRGRGITLMRALSDDCTIDGSPRGTSVCLRFERCRFRVPATA